jgi:hypothetical protein
MITNLLEIKACALKKQGKSGLIYIKLKSKTIKIKSKQQIKNKKNKLEIKNKFIIKLLKKRKFFEV